MTFLLDQDVPQEIADVLRYWGHTATTLREVLPITSSDTAVFAHACDQGAIMLTCNRDDFLKLAAQRHHPGLLILIRRRTRQDECAHLLAILEKAREEGLRGNVNFA